MASRSIDALALPVKSAAVKFIRYCGDAGLELLIYCTLRTNAEQTELYGVGRDASGLVIWPTKVLTYAKAGESLHNPDASGLAWALDAVPTFSGKPLWSDKNAIAVMGACGESAGLEWAGRWSGRIKESVHFQIRK